jgi:hypothetical protein
MSATITTVAATRSRRGAHRLVSVGALVIAATVGALVVNTGTALADSLYNNGSISTATAASNTATHRITVSATAQQMTGYTNGQVLSTQLVTRDDTYSSNGAFTYYGWRTPSTINGTTTTQQCDVFSCETLTLIGAATLNGFSLTGVAGHSYEVWVGFAYWTGSSYTYVWVRADCAVTVISQGQSLTVHGYFCRT